MSTSHYDFGTSRQAGRWAEPLRDVEGGEARLRRGPRVNGLPTVHLVDDEESFLSAMKRLLRASGYTVECFTSARDFLAGHTDGMMGCVLSDLQMPDLDGLALQRALSASDNPLPVVFLTGHGDIPTTVDAMRHGAEDFLAKTAAKADVLSAVDRALERDAAERHTRHRQRDLRDRFSRLTPREEQVLLEVLRGRLNKQIAATLGVDERSVKRHRTHLMRKLGVGSVAQLAQLAFEAGMHQERASEDVGS